MQEQVKSNMSKSKKKEIAHKMSAGKTTKGEFYTQAGDRPNEGTGGEKARQAGPGMEKTKGEKSIQANKGGSFKLTKGTHKQR